MPCNASTTSHPLQLPSPHLCGVFKCLLDDIGGCSTEVHLALIMINLGRLANTRTTLDLLSAVLKSRFGRVIVIRTWCVFIGFIWLIIVAQFAMLSGALIIFAVASHSFDSWCSGGQSIAGGVRFGGVRCLLLLLDGLTLDSMMNG